MGFAIDYSRVSLGELKRKLKTKHLVPSRKLLLEGIDNRFNSFKEVGLESTEDLYRYLKRKETKKDEYLIILLRELNSIQTKSEPIKNFETVPKQLIEKLVSIGIKGTKKLYTRIINNEERERLAEELDVSLSDIEYIAKLADLTRIQWVNHTFSYVLYETGYDTIKKVQNGDPARMHRAIVELNREKGIYKGNIGLNDIVICIEAAKDVPVDIDFGEKSE